MITIKKADLGLLFTAVTEIQQNAQQQIGGQLCKGMHFKLDYDLGRIAKKIGAEYVEMANAFQNYIKEKGITIKNDGSNQYVFPETMTDEQVKEFHAFDVATWSEDIELEIKKFSPYDFENIILQECKNKNIFFNYLIDDTLKT